MGLLPRRGRTGEADGTAGGLSPSEQIQQLQADEEDSFGDTVSGGFAPQWRGMRILPSKAKRIHATRHSVESLAAESHYLSAAKRREGRPSLLLPTPTRWRACYGNSRAGAGT